MQWKWSFVVNVIHSVILGSFMRNLLPFPVIVNDKRSQFTVMNAIMNDKKKGHNTVNDIEQLCSYVRRLTCCLSNGI